MEQPQAERDAGPEAASPGRREDAAAALDEAVRRAEAAQRSWASRTPRERAGLVRSVRHRIVDLQRALIDAVALETGKPVTEIAAQEVTASLELIRFCEARYPAWLRSRRFRYLRPGFWTKTNAVYYDPIGVVAILGPSNFPFSLVTMQACAALLCGNGVALKPSERCPRTAGLIRQIFETSALPDGLVAVVEGAAGAAQHLIDHPSVGKVFFTGSSETGARVAERCGRSFKPCVLELGGAGTAIVCDDADVRLTARGLLWSALYANGRSCIGTRRVLALPGVRPALVDALDGARRALRVGPPGDPATDVTEGHALRLEIVSPGSVECVGDEAPSAVVLRVEDVATLDEAVRAVNASPYGLSASVWSRDARTARSVARRLRVGMVWINDASAALPHFPWGGVRRSGWGRLYAREALPELTHLKVVSHDHRRTARPKAWWFPYSAAWFDLLLAFNAWLYGPKTRAALHALRHAVRKALER